MHRQQRYIKINYQDAAWKARSPFRQSAFVYAHVCKFCLIGKNELLISMNLERQSQVEYKSENGRCMAK